MEHLTENSTIKPKLEEIIRAHDILDIMINDLNIRTHRENKIMMHASLDVLCWILGHPRGETFITNLIASEAELSEQGIIFRTGERGEDK